MHVSDQAVGNHRAEDGDQVRQEHARPSDLPRAYAGSIGSWAGGTVLLGAGTAMVYPTLLAAIEDVAPQRSGR